MSTATTVRPSCDGCGLTRDLLAMYARHDSTPVADLACCDSLPEPPTVPLTGGTGWPAPHHHAPDFLASCMPCIRGEAHGA